MTNMSFTLSTALQQQLAADTSPYVFALEYAGGQFVPGGVYTLASPGSIPTGAVSVPLPASFASGQVFVIVAPNGNANLGTTISTTRQTPNTIAFLQNRRCSFSSAEIA